MVKKSVIFSILLIICWSIYIKNNPTGVSQSQWQDNMISAERFVFDNPDVDNLIVGSSLARRLQRDSLPNYYNLSMSGQGVFDGLNILTSKKNLPSNVFIEINMIIRHENETFRDIISSPILNGLKRHFQIFRSDKQPLALLSHGIASPELNKFIIQLRKKETSNLAIEKTVIKIPIASSNNSNEENKPIKKRNKALEEAIKSQKKNYSKKIDSIDIENQFNILFNHIKYLKSKNVNIVFFEMPVNPELISLNRATYLRNRIENDFPNYKFIKLPDNIKYITTTDGVHLTPEESNIYTSYFKGEATKITQQ